MSIDIDDPDYYIWKNTEKYTPKIVIIEINHLLGPQVRLISELRPSGLYEINHPTDSPQTSLRIGKETCIFGTSFKSMVNLGKSKGYTPVFCTPRGNVIFVLDELTDDVDLRPEEYRDPANLFIDEWKHPKHPYPPFYEQSIVEMHRAIKESVQENGVVKTGQKAVSKIINDIF